MRIKNPEKRLEGFWGKVDAKHSRLISDHIKGKDVLDIGCGYGTTTHYIKSESGINCTGMDIDEDSLDLCRKKYPEDSFIHADAENIPFGDSSFDTIILRDSLHHFYGDSDFEKVKNEIFRICRKGGRIIFFDPNVNSMLKIMRFLSNHKDEECSYEKAIEIAQSLDLKIIYKNFNTLFSIPLSGGYVGINFVPNIKFIQSAILWTEKIAEKVVLSINLGRNLCWRYLIVAEKQ